MSVGTKLLQAAAGNAGEAEEYQIASLETSKTAGSAVMPHGPPARTDDGIFMTGYQNSAFVGGSLQKQGFFAAGLSTDLSSLDDDVRQGGSTSSSGTYNIRNFAIDTTNNKMFTYGEFSDTDGIRAYNLPNLTTAFEGSFSSNARANKSCVDSNGDFCLIHNNESAIAKISGSDGSVSWSKSFTNLNSPQIATDGSNFYLAGFDASDTDKPHVLKINSSGTLVSDRIISNGRGSPQDIVHYDGSLYIYIVDGRDPSDNRFSAVVKHSASDLSTEGAQAYSISGNRLGSTTRIAVGDDGVYVVTASTSITTDFSIFKTTSLSDFSIDWQSTINPGGTDTSFSVGGISVDDTHFYVTTSAGDTGEDDGRYFIVKGPRSGNLIPSGSRIATASYAHQSNSAGTKTLSSEGSTFTATGFTSDTNQFTLTYVDEQ